MSWIMQDGLCLPQPRDYAAERREEQRKAQVMREVCAGIRHRELSRICARFEFEDDQFSSAMDKARRYLDTGQLSARY